MLGLASCGQNDPSVLPAPGTPAARKYALRTVREPEPAGYCTRRTVFASAQCRSSW